MKSLKVSLVDDFELVMAGPKRRERLLIRSIDYSRYFLSQFLFSNLGLMHLVAPYLPKKIETDFLVHPNFQALIGEMYRSCSQDVPEFSIPEGGFGFGSFPETTLKKVVIAYSGGKDSMWNLWWAQEKYGKDNVLAVHISGLNPGQGTTEDYYVRKQSQEFGFDLRIIDLLNSSRNGGYGVMRSRDMFLTGLLVPLALDFGASRIITEGRIGNSQTPFTGQAESFRFFNGLLKDLSIPVKVAWRYRKSMYTVKDLFVHRPSWLPLVCNCFTGASHWKSFHRRYWANLAPTFTLYESQCGSCVKCRTINLGRLLYDPAFSTVSLDDARTFLFNTARWIHRNRVRVADMIQGSFLKEFERACRLFGLDPNRLLK